MARRSKEYQAFRDLTDRVLAVPRATLAKRIAERDCEMPSLLRFAAYMLRARPPRNVSATSTSPPRLPPLVSSCIAKRIRCNMNHAVFWVTPTARSHELAPSLQLESSILRATTYPDRAASPRKLFQSSG